MMWHANADAVASVARRMRADDWREIEPFLMPAMHDPVRLAETLMAASPVSAVWLDMRGAEPVPQAAGGCSLLAPGYGSLWFFATDDAPRRCFADFRAWAVKTGKDTASALGVERIDVICATWREPMRRWLSGMGLTAEATHRDWPRRGLSYVRMCAVL